MNTSRGKKTNKFFLISTGAFSAIGLIILIIFCYNWLTTGDINFSGEFQVGFGIIIFFWGIMILSRFRNNSLHKVKFKYSNNSPDIRYIFENLKQTHSNELKRQRNRTIFKVIIINLLVLGIAIFYIKIFEYVFKKMTVSSVGIGILYGFLCFTALIFALIRFYFLMNEKDNLACEYVEKYKNIILPDLLKCVDSSFNLQKPYENPSLIEEIRVSHLETLDDTLDCSISINDIISGYEGKIKIANINVWHSTYETGNTLTSVSDLVTFSTSNKFNDYIKIKMSKAFLSNLKKIEINHTEFNKYFYVYAHSEEAAKNVVNAQLIKVLLEFYKKYNIRFEVLLINGNIYITLWGGRFFNTSMFRKVFSEKKVLRYYSYINAIKELCLALDANIK